MLLAVRISSYGCTWEVWRALKKLELHSAIASCNSYASFVLKFLILQQLRIHSKVSKHSSPFEVYALHCSYNRTRAFFCYTNSFMNYDFNLNSPQVRLPTSLGKCSNVPVFDHDFNHLMKMAQVVFHFIPYVLCLFIFRTTISR